MGAEGWHRDIEEECPATSEATAAQCPQQKPPLRLLNYPPKRGLLSLLSFKYFSLFLVLECVLI